METATVELTKDEAALLPLLYKVRMDTSLEAAPQIMRYKLLVDGLVKKVNEAFTEAPETKPPRSAQDQGGSGVGA